MFNTYNSDVLASRTREGVVNYLKNYLSFGKIFSSSSMGERARRLTEALLWAYESEALNSDKMIMQYPQYKDIFVVKIFCECCGRIELVPMERGILENYLIAPLPYKNASLYEFLTEGRGTTPCGLENIVTIVRNRLCTRCLNRSAHKMPCHVEYGFKSGDLVVVRNRQLPEFGAGPWGIEKGDSILKAKCTLPFSDDIAKFDGKVMMVREACTLAELYGDKARVFTSDIVECISCDDLNCDDQVSLVVPIYCLDRYRPWQEYQYTPDDDGASLSYYENILVQPDKDGANISYKSTQLIRVNYERNNPESLNRASNVIKNYVVTRFAKSQNINLDNTNLNRTILYDMLCGASYSFKKPLKGMCPPLMSIVENTKNPHLYVIPSIFGDKKVTNDYLKKFNLGSSIKPNPAYLDVECSTFYSNGMMTFLPKKGDIVKLQEDREHRKSIAEPEWRNNDSICKECVGVVENVYTHAFIHADRPTYNTAECRGYMINSSDEYMSPMICQDKLAATYCKTPIIRVNYPHFTYRELDENGKPTSSLKYAPIADILEAHRSNITLYTKLSIVLDEFGAYNVVDENGVVLATYADEEEAKEYSKSSAADVSRRFCKSSYVADAIPRECTFGYVCYHSIN